MERVEQKRRDQRGLFYMKLKILSWNVREVNDVNKRKVIKALIKSQKVDVVCLQETKMQDMSIREVQSLGVGRFLQWGAMNAKGTVRGAIFFWDNKVLELVGMKVGHFSISCRFKNYEDGFLWFFTGIYGSIVKKYRENF